MSWFLASSLSVLLFLSPLAAQDRLLLIQGAPGVEEYQLPFSQAINKWEDLAKTEQVHYSLVAPGDPSVLMKDRIHNWITSDQTSHANEIWIVYVGHGTHNESGTKLNLEGPDLSAAELADWLASYRGTLVFINGGSASAPFIEALSGESRILITATRNGAEVNYARFAEFFADAISDPKSDLDLDNSVSLLEAFIASSNAVETFYREAGRLSSEHALIDDDGDGVGHEVSSFNGIRLKALDQDGHLARHVVFGAKTDELELLPGQLQERNRLESLLEVLYSKKHDIPEEDYFSELESILDKLADLYRQAEDS